MRVCRFVVLCLLSIGCARVEPPVQDPLDYLRVGVDPEEEAQALIDDLRRGGFRVERRLDTPGFVAFDAMRGPETLVRVVSSRGVALSLQAPDVRWPERLWVELAPHPQPDFDGDGNRDVIVAIRERERTCLGWAQVDAQGFVTGVFRAEAEWGEAPCIIEIDPFPPRVLLEVSVPDVSPASAARVRLPIRTRGQAWVIDHESPSARALWERQTMDKQQALAAAELRGDVDAVARLRAELAWLNQLRNAKQPVLERADDGEEAR